MSQKVNGAIVIETGLDGRFTYIVEELAFCKRFTMGQLFHAVRNHNGKRCLIMAIYGRSIELMVR